MTRAPAVFLDRDGVLVELVFKSDTRRYESCKDAGQVKLKSGVERLADLKRAGFKLVVVSNQPDIAKGKINRQEQGRIEERFAEMLAVKQISMDGVYYCYHHPEGTVKELAVKCGCRKPGIELVLRAAEDLGIDVSRSWFVGDRASDVVCGRNAGCRTILVRSEQSEHCDATGMPDHVASDLGEAVDMILSTVLHRQDVQP